jgi:hypothetical protein
VCAVKYEVVEQSFDVAMVLHTSLQRFPLLKNMAFLTAWREFKTAMSLHGVALAPA